MIVIHFNEPIGRTDCQRQHVPRLHNGEEWITIDRNGSP